jgi:S1-C subfamily serine protease
LVGDLADITPCSYIELGGGIIHQLSYQLAKSYMIPVEGVFVAAPGYMFGHGGVPKRSIITTVNNIATPDLETFISVVQTLKDSERVPVQYFELI